MNLFINLLREDPAQYATIVVAIILSIVLHELAHGWTAVWFGDRTPIEMDHLTPNPLVHMGMTSIILVLLFGIGWGQMPVNPNRMRGRYAEAIVAAAGPAMNVLLAFASLTFVGVYLRSHPFSAFDESFLHTLVQVLKVVGILNILLALFNLIPIPPLDGSRILANVLPAYRDWLSSPTMVGVVQAVFFAAFFFSGTILAPLAAKVATQYVQFIRTA